MPNEHDDAKRFLADFNQEKRDAMARRVNFINRKLAFVGGLFAVGIAPQLEATLLLYIVPSISICYDLYIMGEDFGIKRMGSFVRNSFHASADGVWEVFVSTRRDKFSRCAIPLLTFLVLIACTIAIQSRTDPDLTLFTLWYVAHAAAIFALFFYFTKLMTTVDAQSSARLLIREAVLDRNRMQWNDILDHTEYGDPERIRDALTLSDLDRPWTLETLLEAYRSETDLGRRLSLLRVLGASQEPRVAVMLHELLSDDSIDIRLAALGGLWKHYIRTDGVWRGGIGQMFSAEAEWWKLHEDALRQAANARDEQDAAEELPSMSD